MDIILNQIAIWSPCGAKEINIRPSPVGERYRNQNVTAYQTAAKPLIRYAKDYTVGKVKFSLFVRTFSANADAVEAELDRYAKEITKEYALNAASSASTASFTYTPYAINVEGA